LILISAKLDTTMDLFQIRNDKRSRAHGALHNWWSDILATLLALSVVATIPVESSAADAFAVFSIPRYPDEIFVSVMIDGVEHLCALDSGSTANAFHTTLRPVLGDSHGREKYATATGERISAEVFDGPAAHLGTIAFGKDSPASCFDLTPIQEAEGVKVEGIIGMPLFRSNTVELDFDAHRLVIRPASIALDADRGVPIRVTYNRSELPTIHATFGDNIIESCIVDTGFTGTLALASKLYTKLSKQELISQQEDSSYAMTNGLRTERQGLLRSIKVADFSVSNVLVTDGGKESRVGLKLLRRFRVTFDLPRDRIYLAKGTAFDKPDKQPAVGVGLLRKSERTVVCSVDPDSPGEKAGIAVNDELLSIAGELVAERPLAEARWMLRDKADASGRVNLVLRRGTATQKATVVIRD
jgi:predicted aspartyl protease